MAMPPHFYTAAKDVPFFHYTSLDGAIGMLTSRTIWMSDFACMNDPQEYHYARAAFLEAYHARTQYIDLAPRLHLTTSLLSLEANTRMFIACVSPGSDDPHQWERYGDGGRGCVIELDAEFLEQRAGISIRQVVYSRRDFERVVEAGLRMMQTQYEEATSDHEELEYLAKSRLRLGPITDDKPVKLTVELSGTVHRDLLAYVDAHARATELSQPLTPEKIAAAMIERFMATDRGFARARRER